MRARTMVNAAIGGTSMGLLVEPGWQGSAVVVGFTILLVLLMEPRLRVACMGVYWRVRHYRAYNDPLVVDEDGTLHAPILLPGESIHAHQHDDGSQCYAVLDRNGLPRKTLHLPAGSP